MEKTSDLSETAKHQAAVSPITSIHPSQDTALSFLIHRFYVSPLEPNTRISVQNRPAIYSSGLLGASSLEIL